MRINVYSEEMTDDIVAVEKADVIGEDGQPTTFYGIRWYLESSDKMHRTEHDDDRSAVTFWFRPGPEARVMAERFGFALGQIEELWA